MTRSGTSWPPLAAGITLVETVVGSAILGALLVSILMARVQMDSQSRRSQGRLEACQALEELLNQRWQDPSALPRNATGRIKARSGWTWRTSSRQRPDAQALHGEVVTVEVFGPQAGDRPAQAAVELLLPVYGDESKATQPSPDAR